MRSMFGISPKPYRFAPVATAALFTIATGWAFAPSAQAADGPLVQYELQGQPGTQTSNTPSFVAPSITGLNLTEGSGVTPSGAANSISATGWNDLGPNDYFQFGFNVTSGNTASIDSVTLATRSSGTGPGFINVQYSVDGGSFTTLTTLTQGNGTFLDQILSFAPITANSSFIIRLVAASNTSANGGTIGAAGTFRLGDYNPSGTPTPVTITGSVTATTVTPPSTITPEPGSLAFLLPVLGTVGTAGIAARKRRKN